MIEIDLRDNTLQISQDDAIALQSALMGKSVDVTIAGVRSRIRILRASKERRACDYCALNPHVKGEGVVICDYWRLCYASQRPDGKSARFVAKRTKNNGESI